MYLEKIIYGRFIFLKSIEIDDAEFSRNIRRDANVSKFLPSFDNTIEQQKQWIMEQQKKDGDYFFIVYDINKKRIGTISIYNINEKFCEIGRIVIFGNAFQTTEAQLLLFKFAFELGIETLVAFDFVDNKRAIKFDKQFNPIVDKPKKYDNGHMMIKLTFFKKNVEKAIKKLENIIYKQYM